MEAYCKFFGIYKIHTTAYRPQGNGANERMHQELTKYFSIYLDGGSKSKWRWLLQDAAHAYNIAYHTALHASPFEILFGEKPSLGPLGIPTDVREEDNFPRYFGIRRKQLLLKRKMAQEAIDKAQSRMLALKNKHARKIHLRIGDLVLYKNHVPKTKFDAKFKGPWRVVNIISPVVYELDKDGHRFSAHVSYLKLYRPASREEKDDRATESVDDNGNNHHKQPLEGEVIITQKGIYQPSRYRDEFEDDHYEASDGNDQDSDNNDQDSDDDMRSRNVTSGTLQRHSQQYIPKRLQSRYSGTLKSKPRFIKNLQKRLQVFVDNTIGPSDEKDEDAQGRGKRDKRRPVKYGDYEVSYKG
jgi:hypothetical protein